MISITWHGSKAGSNREVTASCLCPNSSGFPSLPSRFRYHFQRKCLKKRVASVTSPIPLGGEKEMKNRNVQDASTQDSVVRDHPAAYPPNPLTGIDVEHPACVEQGMDFAVARNRKGRTN